MSIRIRDVESRKMTVGTFKVINWCVYCVAYSLDGKRVTSGPDDYAIRIFEAETGEVEVGPTPGHDNWILSVKFSTVGKLIASGSTYMTIRS